MTEFLFNGNVEINEYILLLILTWRPTSLCKQTSD